jgi:hypothetical protein
VWQANVGRLIWKEYRVQRSVWLSLLAGTSLLQGVVAFSVGPDSLGQAVFALAFVLSACYAAACAGILFAGEREEETDLCLRQLPLPPGRLVTAKLLFAVVTVAAFVAASLLSGRGSLLLANIPLQEALKQDLSLLARAVVGIFVWGLLFSLLVRRVLVVVLCAAVMELVVTGVVGNFTETHEHRAYFAVVAAVALIDLCLGLRWAAGEGVLPVPHFGALASRAHLGPSTRWVRWLSWAVQRGSPLARTCGALVWRELRTAAAFCLWWIPLGVLFVDLLPRFMGIPANGLFLVATPLVCGLLVCLGDQRRQTHRFLCERGISAVTVWVSKQAVWLLLALAVAALFGTWDALTPGRFRNAAAGEPFNGVGPFVEVVRHTICVPTVSPLAPFDRPEDRALQWEFVWALVLSLYVIGQLASFWIRRSVLAFGAALVGATVVGVWLGILIEADVPLAYGAWPAVVAWSAASLFLAGRWLHSDTRWRTRLLQCAWVIVPAVGVAAASVSYRAHQVPLVDSRIQWPSLEYRFDQFDPAWSQEWREMLGELDRHAARLPTSDSDDLAGSHRLETRLVELGDALAKPHGGIDPLAMPPGENTRLASIGTTLSVAARRHEAAGELPSAWRDYVGGLRITRYLARQCSDWNNWTACQTARGVLLEGVRRWAAHPEQTPESLRDAFDVLSGETSEPVFARDMLMNRCQFYGQLVQRRGRLWEQIAAEVSLAGSTQDEDEFACAAAPAFERQRIHRLVALATVRTLSPASGGADTSFSAVDLARWRASTLLLPPDFSGDLTGAVTWDGSANREFRQTFAAEQATRLVLALQHYRRQHGEFPERLEALLGAYFNELPRDPYTNGWFGYEPEGFPTPLHVVLTDTVAARQPMLWSAGVGHGQIVRLGPQNIQFGQGQIIIPADHYFATNWFQPMDQSVREPRSWNQDPDRVVFAILGRSVDSTTMAAGIDEPVNSDRDQAAESEMGVPPPNPFFQPPL